MSTINKNGRSKSELLKEVMARVTGLSGESLDSVMKNLAANIKKEKEKAEEKRRLEEEEKKRAEELELAKEAERVERITSMDLPLDFENAFEEDPAAGSVTAESAEDALVLSLNNLGRVDIEYISRITGESMKSVIGQLRGAIYQNPDKWEECFYRGWEISEEYLSGNIIKKWNAATEANKKYNGYFAANVEALEAVLPRPLSTSEIYVTLGSPWVPTDIIDDFINHILNLKKFNRYNHTLHDEITGTWELPNKSAYHYRSAVASQTTYGTPRLEALYILEKTLNMRSVSVTDEVRSRINTSGTKRVINESETLLALEKQDKLIKEFQRWVWRDPARKDRLRTIFENNFGSVKRRIFDGSFLKFPTLSPDIKLYQYQKNAVARIIFSPNTLLAHDVGSGKTYIMIAAGMELRRMGISKKNLYVVPPNIVGQWSAIFKSMYPNAKLLIVDSKNFTPAKRQQTLEKLRDEDFDGIIMAYSCFERIPISKEYFVRELEETKASVEKALADCNKTTSKLNKKREAISKQLSELVVAVDKAMGEICFDELGITRLFVDEAHNYKNLPIETKTSNVLGISAGGSKKCSDMLDKVRIVQNQNNGGGVIFATGTPITNSITEAYVIQKYLQSGELALLDLQNFDSWIGMFAEKRTEFEIDVDTSSYRLATRFSHFHNLPELTVLLSSIADFHQVDKSDGIPECDGRRDALIGKTDAFQRYLQDISKRAEYVRGGAVKRTEDNMLKITSDGRKAALDLRIVDPTASFTHQSKAMRLCENVIYVYRATTQTRGTQLIFCDTSTPKNSFNMYDEIKTRLVDMGIPAEEIAFIHDADTEKKRNALFAMVRAADVRVLIGSTSKMGMGVNIQNKLVALHHLDIPWRPADMTQREGRILRQGNENEKVFIFRYITEGSFDAYSWQLLETKERFIYELLSGSLTQRSASDIEDIVLDYAEIKALAVGDPLIKTRVEVANELNRAISLQRKAKETRIELESELGALPDKIARQKELIERCEEDIVFYRENAREYSKEERREVRDSLALALSDNIMTAEERVAASYQGFDILLPSDMIKEKPYLWLSKNGRYYIELGESETGMLIRIDNFLESFDKHLEKLKVNLTILKEKEKDIVKELGKKESYSDKITSLRKKLESIDKKLGVNKNG